MDLTELNILNLEPLSRPNEFMKLKTLFWNEENHSKDVEELDPPFLPYFFIKAENFKSDELSALTLLRTIDPWCSVLPTDTISYKDEPLMQVVYTNPDLSSQFMQLAGSSSFEADVPYWRRVFCDLGYQVRIPRARLYFDLEVDPRAGVEAARAFQSRIISIAAVDHTGQEFFFCENDEEQMLRDFFKLTLSYEMLCGYNCQNFDIPIVEARCAKHDFHLTDFYLPNMDAMQIYKQMKPKGIESYSLDSVAEKELGETKVDIGRTMHVLWDWFENPSQRHKLREYNMQDCWLVKKIDEKLSMLDLRAELCRLTYYLPTKYRGRMAPGDNLVLHTALSRRPRVAFPTKLHQREPGKEESYEGPLVFEPVPGVHKNVAVVDFKNMHPSIIAMLNLGPDTWLPDKSGEVWAPRGSSTLKKKSIVAEALENLTNLRYKNKSIRDSLTPETDEWFTYDKRQKAAKTQLLAVYGMLGSPKSRYSYREGKFDPSVAENITISCKLVQTFVRGRAGVMGIPTVYGVVDSIFLKFPDELGLQQLVSEVKKIVAELNLGLLELTKLIFKKPQKPVFVDLDRVYRDLLLTKKKQKYAGYVSYEEDKPVDYYHVMGFSSRRGNTMRAVKEFETTLLQMRLKHRGPGAIKKYVELVKQAFFHGALDDKLVLHTQLTKEIDKYESSLPHTRAATALQKRGVDVRVGDKVPYMIIGEDRAGKKVAVPAYPEKPKLNFYHREYIWRNYFQKTVDELPLGLDEQTRWEDFQ